MAHSLETRERAKMLREAGWTHREIAQHLAVSLGSVHLWCTGIIITDVQRAAIRRRRKVHYMSRKEREVVAERLARHRITYSKEKLLERIREFYARMGRIPLKREFNAWDSYARVFGSWNAAIRQAGLEPNPELFSRKFTAGDGHICDSFSEKIIDDYLAASDIPHERNVRYGNTRLTCDFVIFGRVYVEFFGLAGMQRTYDQNIERKRLLAANLGVRLIELYPADVHPVSKLAEKIRIS